MNLQVYTTAQYQKQRTIDSMTERLYEKTQDAQVRFGFLAFFRCLVRCGKLRHIISAGWSSLQNTEPDG